MMYGGKNRPMYCLCVIEWDQHLSTGYNIASFVFVGIYVSKLQEMLFEKSIFIISVHTI